MQKLILAAILAVCPAIAWAVPFAQDLPPGVHYQKITVAADGTVTAERMPLVTPGGPSPKPPPVDPDDPPPDLTAFTAEVKLQTQAVLQAGGSKTTGAALSAVYGLAASGVADGSIATDKAFAAVKAGTDAIMAVQTDRAKWDGWRKDIGEALTALQAAGKLSTAKQISDTLAAISKGLDGATGNSLEPKALAKVRHGSEFAFDTDGTADGILDGINLAQLIELIKLLMELFKLFGGG